MTQKEIIEKLNESTEDYNFIYILAGIILKDFCSPIEYLEHRDAWKHLNYNEAAFLIGLWIKNCKINIRNQYQFEQKLNKTYELMEDLHKSFIFEAPNPLEKDQNISIADFMTNSMSFRESFFYSSTGAYDFQYVNKFTEKYKYDEDWLLKNKGFSLNDPKLFFTYLKGLINQRLNSPRIKGNRKLQAEDLLFPFVFTHHELTNNNKSFAQLVSHFIIKIDNNQNTELINVGDFNEFQTKPIIHLEKDKYFIPMPFHLAEAIYESPFYWMTSDKEYSSKCLNHRGIIGEEIVYNLFTKIFGASNTFKGVLIKENKTKTIGEIDVCSMYENTLVALQVKSKKLTSISKQGNVDKIKDDFSKAVESAFLQGLECEKAILNSKDYLFISYDNKDIKNKFLNIEKVYSLCLVLDTYPALTHTTYLLLYEKYKESTICFTVFELEVLCRYLNSPKRLVDYVTKRIENCRYYRAENELCFLGFYLDHDLKPLEKYNAALIDSSYGSKIDGLYYPEISGYNDQQTKQKIGRNDLCPCGSGAKYKKCHGK